jgi:CheY-like chemotaxis protein
MGGIEAAGKISSQYPDVNIIFTSGYPESSQYTKSVIETGRPVVLKPFGVDLLRSKVRTALDNKSDKGAETG